MANRALLSKLAKANYVFWIFVSTRFHHHMQVPWHALIRIFFSCACSFLSLSPAHFVIVWFLWVLCLVFVVILPTCSKYWCRLFGRTRHYPSKTQTICPHIRPQSKPNKIFYHYFRTSHTPGIISRPQSTQWIGKGRAVLWCALLVARLSYLLPRFARVVRGPVAW